jgi:RNA polymerase sigma-70 factor (sigma-E family)
MDGMEEATESRIHAPASQAKLRRLYADLAAPAQRLAFLLTGDEDLAQDISHDAFIKLYGRFSTIRDANSLDAYLRRTVVNLARDHFRRRKVERSFIQRHGPEQASPPPVPDVETTHSLWGALGRLPYRHRAVLVLRFYEDMSEQQAAEVMDCSVSAVKSLTARAMKNLRNQMRGDEHDG